jgi:hypothetical protein
MTGNIILLGQGSEWFWSAVQAVLVLVSALFLYRQLVAQSRADVVSAIESIWARFDSHEMLQIRARVAAYYLDGGRGLNGDVQILLGFWEQVGTYVRLKSLPLDAFSLSFVYYIDYYQEAFRGGIRSYRAEMKDFFFFSDMEMACEKMRGYMQRQGQPIPVPKDEHLMQFFRDEFQSAMRLLPEAEFQEVLGRDFAKVAQIVGTMDRAQAAEG